MTKEETTVLIIKGAIAGLPEQERQLVLEQYNKIRTMLVENPLASLAIALIGAEMSV
jgi:hypothetical protein